MNTFLQRTRSASKRGFTLIEIMVATVIMIVLVGLVIQITSEVLKVWTRSSGKLSANAEARIAMDLITQDLETAVFRNNGQQWLRVDAPEASGGSYSGQTVGLKLFSPALDRPTKDSAGDDIPGDICAIGYRLAYKESYDGGTPVYALYRRIVDPKTTFETYLGTGTASASPQGSLAAPGQLGADWSNVSIELDDNYLVSNIVGFKVLIYELDSSNPAQPVADLVNADDNGTLTIDYAYGGLPEANVMSTRQLLYADVILTVVSDEGLELLGLLEDNRGGTGYATVDDVVREHGETFTRRVNFMAHPL